MGAKANRKRARRARQLAELLSLRAELTLAYDGDPVPPYYLSLNRMDTRDVVRGVRDCGYVPRWMKLDLTRSGYPATI